MRELTGDTIIRIRKPLPLPRKRELTGDTRIRLSQIVDLKDWALEMAQDEAAPEGAVHHWSDGDHVKKNGKWVPMASTKLQNNTQVAKAKSKHKLGNTKYEAAEKATKHQEKQLKNYSISVNVKSIRKDSIEIVHNTIKKLWKEYDLKPLEVIEELEMEPGDMAESNHSTLHLGLDFFNNPEPYYTRMEEERDKIAVEMWKFKHYHDMYPEEKIFTNAMKEAEEKNIRSNVLYEGREVESVMLHEIGHIISDQKIGLVSGYNKDSIAILKVQSIYLKAMTNGDMKYLSTYAMKDPAEFFAEAFVVYKFGAEKLSDYLNQMIEEVIK